ncbi:MAG TPA: hypothetical protein VMR14_16155 [Streptosporangiaceae bacterium]|nr:hypothetical protein [Streptosporangiaceae bacterium]
MDDREGWRRGPDDEAPTLRPPTPGRSPMAGDSDSPEAKSDLIEFGGHPIHVTAKPGHLQRASAPGKVTLTPVVMQAPLADNGGRCAVQVGRNLELGIELVNQSSSPVIVRRITPVFALGGFRPTTSGAGSCGALPESRYVQPTAILPGATEWVAATLKVLVHCPQARPVGFKLRYSQSGKTGTTVFNAFPDLGQIPYRGCTTASGRPPTTASPTTASG